MTLLRRDWQWFVFTVAVTNGVVIASVLLVDYLMKRFP